MAAGISVDYVTRLEQGRAGHPSAQVVEALARALRLSRADREHLFATAGLVPPGRGEVPGHIPPSVHRMLDRLSGVPVAVFDAAWTQLSANRLHVALLGDHRGRERNAVWRNFLGSGGRVRYTPQARRRLDAQQVADLRATASRYPADRRLRELITELRDGSERFAAWWQQAPAPRHEPARKTIEHPEVGTVVLDCDLLQVLGDDLRIMVYTAEPGSADEERLSRLAAEK